MKQFDFNVVLKHYDPDLDGVANVLFPHLKYKRVALARVMAGESDLDISQVESLAEYLGVLVTDLFSLDTWKGTTEQGQLAFTKGDYSAKINYNGTFLSIYEKEKLIWNGCVDSASMTIDNLITLLNQTIKSIENGN